MQLLRISGLLLAVAAAPMVFLGGADDVEVVLLRLFAAIVLSFLPGWLFLRFVMVRAQSVWEEYVLNLHRLGMDSPQFLPRPPVNSMYYAEWKQNGGPRIEKEVQEQKGTNIYKEKFEAYYGKSTAHAAGEPTRLKAETFFPVVLATAMFAVGWVTVLREPSILSMAEPSTLDILRLAFMGAYLFIVQMLVRRYFQADLKASAYVNAVIRVVSALVLVAVADLSILTDLTKDNPEQRIAIAFIVGFFPLVGLQALQKVAAVALRTAVPSLRNDYPLSDLDGLSVWYEARLLELGVEDMENLSTANLVDVTLHSRVPVGRLVDWVDQAHLYLHLEPRESGRMRKRKDSSGRQKLRRLGIRSATSLEAAFARPRDDKGAADGLVSPANNAELIEALRWAVNEKGSGPSVTESLLKTFLSDPNLKHVRNWKHDWTTGPRSKPAVATARTVTIDGARAYTGAGTNGSTAPSFAPSAAAAGSAAGAATNGTAAA